MRSASNAYLAHVANGEVAKLKANLYDSSGTATALTNEDFMEGFSFSGGTSPSGEFTVGGAVTGMFTFSLNNFDGTFDDFDFEGSYIIPYTYYDQNDAVRMGRYYLASHKTLGHVINCVAYDALRLMDMEAFSPTYPIKALAAARQIASNHSLTVNEFANSNVTLPDPGMALTERQALAYIAGFTGNYVRINAEGNIVLEWYNTSSPIEQETIFGQEVEVADSSITGVRRGTSLVGSDGYVINVADNPYINDNNALEALTRIYTRIGGTTFRPGTMTILANPALEGGDCIEYDGVVIVITQYYYRPTVSEDVSCDVVTESETDLRQRYVIAGADGYSIMIESSAGSQFKNSTGSTTLSAKILQGSTELDPDGTLFTYSWKKFNKLGNQVTFSASTKSITVNADSIDEKATFSVEVTW